jgi:hypothetical protein
MAVYSRKVQQWSFVEALPKAAQGVLRLLVGDLCIDLHRDRKLGVSEDLHRDARMYVKIRQEGSTCAAGIVNRDPPNPGSLASAVPVAVERPRLDRRSH